MPLTAYLNPIDWNDFMAMLHSLPVPPDEEDAEFLTDKITELPESHEIFSDGVAEDVKENLERINLDLEQRREIINAFAMLFPLHFTDEYTGDRHYKFSEIELDFIWANLCSPQEVSAIHRKLTELSPVLRACGSQIEGALGVFIQRIMDLCEKYSREDKGFLTYWI
jgi:hypothetical protein